MMPYEPAVIRLRLLVIFITRARSSERAVMYEFPHVKSALVRLLMRAYRDFIWLRPSRLTKTTCSMRSLDAPARPIMWSRM